MLEGFKTFGRFRFVNLLTVCFLFTLAHVKDEINKLINDNVKSAQQKDSLIIQLQQTLIMLCQQQLQKFMPDGQSFSQQTLKNILQKGLLNQSPNQDC